MGYIMERIKNLLIFLTTTFLSKLCFNGHATHNLIKIIVKNLKTLSFHQIIKYHQGALSIFVPFLY